MNFPNIGSGCRKNTLPSIFSREGSLDSQEDIKMSSHFKNFQYQIIIHRIPDDELINYRLY